MTSASRAACINSWAPRRATSSRISGSSRSSANKASILVRIRSVADTRTGTGVTSFFADLQVVKRNLRPCSLFTPDSGHDPFVAHSVEFPSAGLAMGSAQASWRAVAALFKASSACSSCTTISGSMPPRRDGSIFCRALLGAPSRARGYAMTSISREAFPPCPKTDEIRGSQKSVPESPRTPTALVECPTALREPWTTLHRFLCELAPAQ